jgi:hypothetical protein
MCQSSFTISFSGILSEPLWLNSEIEIGGKPVLYQRWAKADVFFINDLLKNEGGFLTLEQFQDKYAFTISFSGLICHFSCDFVGCTLCFSTIIL